MEGIWFADDLTVYMEQSDSHLKRYKSIQEAVDHHRPLQATLLTCCLFLRDCNRRGGETFVKFPDGCHIVFHSDGPSLLYGTDLGPARHLYAEFDPCDVAWFGDRMELLYTNKLRTRQLKVYSKMHRIKPWRTCVEIRCFTFVLKHDETDSQYQTQLLICIQIIILLSIKI